MSPGGGLLGHRWCIRRIVLRAGICVSCRCPSPSSIGASVLLNGGTALKGGAEVDRKHWPTPAPLPGHSREG